MDANVASRLAEAVANSGHRPFGLVPQGLTAEQFNTFSKTLRDGLGVIGDFMLELVGTASPTSDIDIAIRVSPARFDELISQRFGTPNPGSAKERTMLHAIQTGKIQAGEAGLSSLRRSLEAQLGMEVDLSVVRQGGPFDNPPFTKVP